MAQNIFHKVFTEASNVTKVHRHPQSPVAQHSGQENSGTNNMSLNGNCALLMQSTPDFAKTPMKPARFGNIKRMPTRVPNTPQAKKPAAPVTEATPQNTDADVRVYVRVRPLLEGEDPANFEINENKIIARPPPRAQSWKHFAERSFTFTEVLGEQAQQCDVFKTVAMPLLRRFMQGVDALLFAYGATSAGKTYTVQGTPEEQGLIPRMVKILLNSPPPRGTERGLLVSCVEVYNEKVLDLFGDNTKPLRIGKDGFGFTTVKGISEFEIKSEADVTRTLRDIDNARRQCSTKYNAASSRSHCIFMLKLVSIPLDPKTGKRTTDLRQIKCTRLSVVDLAGSERVSADDKCSLTVSEACNINKSMLVLGKCIRQIRRVNKGEATQVPFRESKLTEMFRDFFEPGGRPTMASIIVNISPCNGQFDDTLFALQFAAEAVACNVRTEEDSEEEFEIHSIDLDDSEQEDDVPLVDARMFAQVEARIRQQVHEEMSEKMKKMQNDYQQQVEQIRCQSAQPYTSKLQQALAQRMQTDTRSRELEECIRERDSERARALELENAINNIQNEINEKQQRYEEALKKNQMLEANVTKMIEATKAIHERYVKLKTDLERSTAEKEAFWQRRVQQLESEIARLRS